LGGLTDTAVLAAGTYNYTCYYNTTQNYTGDSEAQQLTINQMQAVVNLTLNGTDGDISLPVNGSVIAVVGTPITPSGAFVELYINGTLAASGTGAQTVNYNFSAGGSYPVMVRYNTTQNYTGATETHYVVVGSALAKINIVPTLNSNINGTSITLSFDTNLNTSCRWSLTDQNYSAMTNTFTTTGLLNHSGTITGLNTLGPETIHVACINETAASNSDWNFNVLNVLISTSVNNSTLTNVTATNSVINGSILNNCTVTNSTVKNYQGSNCVIINSFVDPPNPGSDLTGSTITGNSRVMNSNATYSIVTSSNITNSNVNNSQLITSEVENSALDYCNLTNAEMSGGVVCTNSTVTNSQLYNVTLVNAVITNGVIVNGTMIYNGTNYTNGTVANITNLPPTAAFTYSPATPRRNSNTNFNAGSSSDPNAGDTLTYFWDFGDGTNATGVTTTHRYTITGARTVTLTATDSQGVSDNTTRTFTVAAATTGGNTAGNGGGGGGGGGGSSSYYARNWEIDLDARSMELKTFGRTDTAVITLKNKTYTLRMQGISRDGANFTITNWPYSLENYEIKKVDLDNDGYSEIRVILLNNYYTRAQLRFDRYEELMSTQPAPLISGNMSNLGLVDETLTVGEYEEPEKEKTEITEETKDNTTEQEEATKEETASWMTSLLNKIPKDSETIGLGITVAVVIAGLIVYFLVSLILV